MGQPKENAPEVPRNPKPNVRRVLLLNPPGDEIYIRDYFCSKVSKTNYIYSPVDLLIISGRLRGHAEVQVIDAIAEELSIEKTLERIQAFGPTTVVMLMAAVSWDVDHLFLKKLRETFRGKVIASGDVLMDDPIGMLQTAPELDAIITDFTTPELIDYIEGKPGSFRAIRQRGDRLADVSHISHEMKEKSYDIPMPQHALFPNSKYRYPFVRRLPFVTMLTDFGCAFKCSFCIQSKLDFKNRSVENVLEEMRYLKKQGFKDIYFSDQTFAFNGQRAKELFEGMIREKLNFGWVAFYRVDLVREDMIEMMKKAGCHTLMFGIESANEQLLKDYNKNIKLETVRKALALCRKHGIRNVGTFILGFPHETPQDIEATIRFSLDLPLDYASYNLPVPRSKTTLRTQAVEANLVPEGTMMMDQSGKKTTMGNKFLSREELFKIRNNAIKRFYLRPAYLLRRLFTIRTWDELVINIQDGFVLMREAFTAFRKNN